MMFTRTKTARRREMRRTLTNAEDSRWRRWFSKPMLWAMFWVYVFTVVASLIALSGQNRTRFKVGQVVEETIVARVPFEAINEDETIQAKAAERARVPAVYNANTAYLERIRDLLLSLGRLGADDKIEQLDQIPEETRKSLALQTSDRFNELRRYVMNPANTPWAERIDQFMAEFAMLPVIATNRAKTERSREDGAAAISLRNVGSESKAHDEEIIDAEVDRKVLESRLESILQQLNLPANRRSTRLPLPVQRTIIEIILADKSPLFVFDNIETEKRRTARADAVTAVPVRRQANEVLVNAGTELTRLHLVLLDKERAEYDAQLGATRRWLIRAGSFGLILLIGTGLLVYVSAYNDRILWNPVRGAALICLILLAQGLAVSASTAAPQALYLTGTFPAILTTMVLAIAYDRRFALAVGSITALLILVSLKLNVGYAIIMLTGVTLVACQLPDVKNRSALVIAGFWTGTGMAAATWLVSIAGISVQTVDPFHTILEDSLLPLLGAVVTGLFVQGMLPAIEKTFRVTTAMTLKDLNDASHPLLRRLAEEATGTYQHSLRIADMAEAAADTIGSNGLLCRVGAMYHDIGKINKPEYFVENQGGGPNKHDKLRPAMSLLIIVGHVKDGIEMAKEFKLPKAVIHFIESHHGTTLVEYFYHAARKQGEGDGTSPTEFEFRYPGPKPQTKEAAILMLCDGVEGAARALPEPTPVRLEQLVNKMMLKRLMDGQFDECQITLQELHKVEQAVVRTLTAIYHGRIAYPKSEDEESRESPESSEPAASAG